MLTNPPATAASAKPRQKLNKKMRLKKADTWAHFKMRIGQKKIIDFADDFDYLDD